MASNTQAPPLPETSSVGVSLEPGVGLASRSPNPGACSSSNPASSAIVIKRRRTPLGR